VKEMLAGSSEQVLADCLMSLIMRLKWADFFPLWQAQIACTIAILVIRSGVAWNGHDLGVVAAKVLLEDSLPLKVGCCDCPGWVLAREAPCNRVPIEY
jgi:hypothetical protein